MTELTQKKIVKRLLISFCILILLFISFGIYAIFHMERLSDLTQALYAHPLVVSNASLHAALSVTKMHRSMKDIAFFNHRLAINSLITLVNKEERAVFKNLDIVKTRILGDEGKKLQEKTRALFIEWQPIRANVIQLVKEGKREDAAEITMGKGADHVARLESAMLDLTAYARNKADGFMKHAKHVRIKVLLMAVILIVIGAMISVLTAIFTIKQTLHSNEKASENYNLLQKIVEGIEDPIFVKDIRTRCLLANSSCADIIGLKVTEMIGRTNMELMPLAVAKEVSKMDHEVMDTGTPLVFEEELIVKGVRHTFLSMKTPLKDEQGEVIGIIGIARNITDRKNAENEKALLIEQLQQSRKMEAIGTMAGGIAHDFNNILGIIMGNIELSLEDVATLKPTSDFLSEAKIACLRAKELIKQILDFSRKSNPKKEEIHLYQVVDESLKLLRASLPATITIKQEIEKSKDTILANPTQIQQIMLNLCTNAVQAMEYDGHLTVGIQKTLVTRHTELKNKRLPNGYYLKLSISDTGCGLSPNITDRIFDPYFTTKDIGKGSGMGLSVVYGIIKAHEGEITFKTEDGVGTTFHVYLPVLNDSKPMPSSG